MAKLLNLEITERKLLFLSFVIIVVLSVGLVQSFGSGFNDPSILGHSADELGNTCSWILNPKSGIPSTDARWIECNTAKTTAGAAWNGDYTVGRAAYSYAGAGGGNGSSTVCVQIVGKDQAKCNTLGTGWTLQGSSQQTVDAIWCGMKESQAQDWWGKFGGAGSNQNLLGASWGIGNSFSIDADPSNIVNPTPGYTTSTTVTLLTPQAAGVLGLNPPVWRSSLPPFGQLGVCTEGVLSWRSLCCKTF